MGGAGSEGMRAGEMTLPPTDGGIGWPSQSSAGELALVVQIRESRCTGQLSYNPGPDPGLCVGPPQHLPYL